MKLHKAPLTALAAALCALSLASAATAAPPTAPTTAEGQEQQEAIDSYLTPSFTACANAAGDHGQALERCYVAEIGRQKAKLAKSLAKAKAKAHGAAAKTTLAHGQAAWQKKADAKCSAIARGRTAQAVIDARQCAVNALILRWTDLDR
jgi:uncharacterized protein YecT (DUF1311 family)